ncbi:MAG TPA: HEPN domain-containing protein, partial [Cyclobacteriaceae bacterium]|nr:HEPN domain-containing protein [Cyclobacteriaceae bacterium]
MEAATKTDLFRGEWFLPGRQIMFPGVVAEEPKTGKLFLSLYTSENLDGTALGHGRASYPIILGNALHQTPVTLYNCTWRGTKYIGTRFAEITYQIDVIIDGAQYDKEDDIMVKSVLVEFPIFANWYDRGEADEKLQRHLRTNKIDSKIAEELVQIDANLSVAYVEHVNETNMLYEQSIEYKYNKWVDFRYSNDVPFERAREDWFNYARLLEFTTGKRIAHTVIRLILNATKSIKHRSIIKEREHIPMPCIVYNHYKNIDASGRFIHQNSMLFSSWKMDKDQLNNITRAWFKNRELYPIYDYYLDSNNWFENTTARLSNVMFNNRFLNLIQGLEAYHTRLNDEYAADYENFTTNRDRISGLINEPELKIWFVKHVNYSPKFHLVQRLEGLLSRYEQVLNALFGGTAILKSFPTEARDYRNKLSHGMLKETNLGDDVRVCYLSAQLLLCICVLESLAIDQGAITKILAHNSQYQPTVMEIRKAKSISKR